MFTIALFVVLIWCYKRNAVADLVGGLVVLREGSVDGGRGEGAEAHAGGGQGFRRRRVAKGRGADVDVAGGVQLPHLDGGRAVDVGVAAAAPQVVARRLL